MKNYILKRNTAFLLVLVMVVVMYKPCIAKTVTLNSCNQTMTVGSSLTLSISGVKSSNVKWKSSKTSVAKVSKSGKVKALKKGKATITGTYKDIKFTCKITVKEKVRKTSTVLYDKDDFKITLKKISAHSIYFEVQNKKSKERSITLEWYKLDSKYYETIFISSIPGNTTLLLDLEGGFGDIENIDVDVFTGKFGIWAVNGNLVKYISVKETEIK